MKDKFYLVLDLGTTGVKAFIFDDEKKVVGKSYKILNKNFPKEGWVEQEPRELIEASVGVLREVLNKSGIEKVESIGIANQRETVIIWNKNTGEPVYPAILWEDNRTLPSCQLVSEKDRRAIRLKTGLEINPYFSASKIKWVLENMKNDLSKDELYFGTPDSWLIYNLTIEKNHFTDFTNASRTMLFNINTLNWDGSLLKIFKIPESILPKVQKSRSFFGNLKSDILGFSIPIKAVCGDQESSLFAAGSSIGTTKITYGTGAFLMQIIGKEFSLYDNFFTTLVVGDEQNTYAVEAKVELGASNVSPLLGKEDKKGDLKELIKKICLEVDKYIKILPLKQKEIIIDGGISQYDDIARIQADIAGVAVERQIMYDGTALGIVKMLS